MMPASYTATVLPVIIATYVMIGQKHRALVDAGMCILIVFVTVDFCVETDTAKLLTSNNGVGGLVWSSFS